MPVVLVFLKALAVYVVLSAFVVPGMIHDRENRWSMWEANQGIAVPYAICALIYFIINAVNHP